MNQDIINLYDRFTHGGMSRRAFLDRLAELAGSTAAAAALLPLLQNNYAQAAIVAAETRAQELETTLNDPEFHATRSREAHSLIKELEAAKLEVMRLYRRWDELSTRRS